MLPLQYFTNGNDPTNKFDLLDFELPSINSLQFGVFNHTGPQLEISSFITDPLDYLESAVAQQNQLNLNSHTSNCADDQAIKRGADENSIDGACHLPDAYRRAL